MKVVDSHPMKQRLSLSLSLSLSLNRSLSLSIKLQITDFDNVSKNFAKLKIHVTMLLCVITGNKSIVLWAKSCKTLVES